MRARTKGTGTRPEITLPEAEPALEWILGRAVQKVSPQRRRAIVQGALVGVLRAWGRGRGQTGTEWRFRLTPPGEATRPLVPDVAFLSFERMRGLEESALETPPVAPDIVIEVRSPDDVPANLQHKIDVYLAAGVRLVLVVDPLARRLDAYDPGGRHVVADGTTFTPSAFPDLVVPLAEIFAELDFP